MNFKLFTVLKELQVWGVYLDDVLLPGIGVGDGVGGAVR